MTDDQRSSLHNDLQAFIDRSYSEPPKCKFSIVSISSSGGTAVREDLKSFMDSTVEAETFSERLLRLMADRGLREVELYSSVGMDRKLFSKIKTAREYQPRKRTALLLAVALKLDYDETQELLKTAGYTLTKSSKADLVVEFFLRSHIYDLLLINEALAERGYPMLTKCE